MTDENPGVPPVQPPVEPPAQPPVAPPVQPPVAPPVAAPAQAPAAAPVQPTGGIPPEYAPPVTAPPVAAAPPVYGAPPAAVPPVAPPGYGQPVYAAAPPKKKRRLWPFFVGGGVLLLILLVIGGFVAASVISAANRESDLEAVEQTVLAFDAAYEDVDCGAFEDVTTDDFRDDYAETYYGSDSFDCDEWEADAEGLSEDGEYIYDVEVNKVRVFTNEAQVRTTEEADGSEAIDFVYELERVSGGWVITSYEED